MWSSDGATCISSKFDHQRVPVCSCHGKGIGNREILYEHTWVGALGFDKSRSSDALPGVEDRHSTHSYFVQDVLTKRVQSLEQRILRNSVGFFQSLLSCPCPEVFVMAWIAAWDIRSTLGKNIQKIREITQLDPCSMRKTELHAALEHGLHIEIPKVDSWRLRCLANMLAARSQAFFRADEDEVVRLTSLIDSLVTN